MRWLKKILKLTLWVMGFLVVWFAVVRVTSGSRAVVVSGNGGESWEWDERIRIGCYNIAHGRGDEPGGSNWEGGLEEEREQRLSEIADLISEQDLDLVVLNEVDFDCTWSHGVNQAQKLAKDCGYPYVVEQRNLDLGVPFFRVAIGNAILSRFPIRQVEEVSYPPVNWWEPLLVGKKNGAKAIVQLPDGDELEVFAVHAETRSAEVRKGSVKALLESAGESSIFAGDFNSVRGNDGSNAVNMILENGGWKEGKTKGATFPTRKPVIRIDWIFVPHKWEELNHKVLVSDLSDHAMVIGEWRVK